MDIAWEDAGGVTALATAVTPNRNNGDPNYTEYSYDLSSSSQATEGNCKLNINISALLPTAQLNTEPPLYVLQMPVIPL